MQRSPEARVAVARIVPCAPAITRRSVNDPLGARVTLVAEATIEPFLRSVTFQGTAFRFWSTWNSISRPLSSRLSLSLAVELLLHVPLTRTRVRLCWTRSE